MKGKAFIPLVLGLVVGLFAVKLVIDTVRKSQANQPVAKTTLVRAKADIRAFDLIAPENLEQIEVAETGLVPKDQRVEKLEELKNRVAAKPIPAGAPVLQSMLAPPGSKPGLIGRIPSGYRAVAVKIDESSGVAYSVQPGDLVDVLVVMDVKTGARQKETIAEVLLQGIEVGAVGQGVPTEAEAAKGKSKPAKTATLIVKEEDSPKLHLAATRGKIALSLRGEDEEEVGELASASTSNLLASLMGLEQDAEVGSEQVAQDDVPSQPLIAEQPPRKTSKPYDIVVRRGSAVGDMMETITFESKNSSNIIGVTRGTATPPSTLSGPNSLLGPNQQQLPGQRGPMPPIPYDELMEDQDFQGPRE